MSTLLRDLIDIPERAGDEDYVLRLTDAVSGNDRLDRTCAEYVVTDGLVPAFDQGLGLVAEAIASNESRAAFLSGSFGSGKSHYMAVLHALLGARPAARGITKLQPTIAAHDPRLAGRTVLRLAFHMLGRESMEEALLGGYVTQIAELHPGAPIPAVHHSDPILDDGEQQRRLLGDERFLAELNGDAAADDPWAALIGAGAWTADTYSAARAAGPGTEQRQQLVSALTRAFFSSYTAQAGYLDIDTGLKAISTHAKSLGYDAVVLFIDELVLWLAFGVQDREFFRREAQKLTKLVESTAGARPIPLVSFVARQMDLRRWFADSGASGAEQDMLDQAFRHQQGRFATITLGDDNLPEVAQVRLLRPRTDRPDAAAEIAEAFAGLDRRRDVWDVLLDGVNTDERHRGSDEKAFRLTYPFSPALISTLRSLAGVMQRERTALKVMQRMLVDRRDTLTVDDVIPVGDAYDLLVAGSEPLDSQVAGQFRSANKLYRETLRPLVLRMNGTSEEQLRTDPGAVPRSFHTDDRLAKTLLLSAVAPGVPALREITGARLASLNHGSVLSPLPGNEATMVLSKVQEWSRMVPEILVGEGKRDPLIRVRLSDVDYESVVQSARGEDNAGRRRELVRTMVREALGVPEAVQNLTGAITHTVVWRGSTREVDLVFGNVRDRAWLPDDSFRARAGTWRFVIDHPFDDPGHTSAQDLERIDGLIAREVLGSTVVWLPRFLSEERTTDLSRLVVLDWLLTGTGDRWKQHSDHLSESDRIQARGILESNRRTLHLQIAAAVQQAYGAAAPVAGNLLDDAGHEQVLVSLSREFRVAAPVGADLAAAFANLVDQAFRTMYPAHPVFEPLQDAVKPRELALVAGYVERAVADPNGWVYMDGADRTTVRRIAGPLRIGTAAETKFLFGDDRFPWGAEIERAMARDGRSPTEPVTVAQVRGWIDASRGLRPEVADLVIIAWAALRQRGWYGHSGPEPTPPRPGTLRPEQELRPEPLPSVDQWTAATERARVLFTGETNPHLTPASLAALATRIQAEAQLRTDAAARLVTELERAHERVGLSADVGDRLATARATAELVAQLARTTDRVSTIRTVATTPLPGSDPAAVRSLLGAAPVATALAQFRWDRLAPLQAAVGADRPGASHAAQVLDDLREVLTTDEFDQTLSPALAAVDGRVFDWVARYGGRPDPDPDPEPDPTPDPTPPDPARLGSATRPAGGDRSALLAELTRFLDENPDVAVRVDWRLAP